MPRQKHTTLSRATARALYALGAVLLEKSALRDATRVAIGPSWGEGEGTVLDAVRTVDAADKGQVATLSVAGITPRHKAALSSVSECLRDSENPLAGLLLASEHFRDERFLRPLRSMAERLNR